MQEVGVQGRFVGHHRARTDADGHAPAERRQRVHDGLFLDQALAALGHLVRGVGVGAGQQHDKLLTAVARHQVPWAVQGQAQRLGDIDQAGIALDVAIQVVVLLEEVHVEEQHGQGLLLALRLLPGRFEVGVEAAAVGDVGQAVLEGQDLQLLLQAQQFFLGLLAFADVEHEADQGLHLALGVAHHVHHVADPYIAVVLGQRPVVGLVVHPALGLGDAEIHHAFTVFRVHAHGPVLHADPAVDAPAQQGLDLRADVAELHRGPVDLPGNRLRRFQQGLVHAVVVFEITSLGHTHFLS